MKSFGSSTSEATSRLSLQIGGRTKWDVDRAVLGRAKRQAERCIKQGIPYQVFNKWFRDRKKRIVPVEIVGRDEEPKPEAEAEEKKAEGPKRTSCVKYVKLVFGNGLRIEKKNLSYHELKEIVGKLEGLC